MERDLRTSDVARRVAEIESVRLEYEEAHLKEDALHQDAYEP
jgi:hypothetical protein